MEIQYVLINFILLAIVLVVFGRKMALKIFRGRRESIINELDEAERIESI